MRLKSRLHPKNIQFHLKFILLAILIGLISVFFVKMVEFAWNGFMWLESMLGWWLLLYVPTMMMLIVVLLKKYFPEAEGSGLPQVLAIENMDIAKINYFFNIRSIFSKILLVTLGTLSGGTLGREGATIQIGASLMNQLGRNLSMHRRKAMLIVGAAAGLASAFNTPLGGIVFAFEELVKTSRTKSSLFKITGVAISGIVSVTLLSNYSYFGRVNRNLLFYSDKILVAAFIIGIASGLFSVAFSRVVRFLMLDNSPLVTWRAKNPYKTAFISGIIVAIVGILSHGLSFGNGYSESRMALSNQIDLPASYVFYKMISAIFTTNAGVPGGYFATSLAIGNGIGSLIYQFVALGNIQQYYLLGMVSFLAALTRAPTTAIVMVVQISAAQIFTLPLIVAALTATLLANALGKGIYEYQMRRLI